jgi:hypothetical protein
MARKKLHFVGVLLTAEQYQAVKRLSRLKKPHLQCCTSSVIRDCVEHAYWPLSAKYSGVPVDAPKPLPPVTENLSNV